MKFSLMNGVKTEPAPKLRGTCALCGGVTIARCGNYKVWHWAHQSKKQCDNWSEHETEWHREWKNFFPLECQEVVHRDETTGEKHIADVKTLNNMVIEFQKSYIKDDEIFARESFYKRMIWIIQADIYILRIDLTVAAESKQIQCKYFGSSILLELTHFGSSKLFDRWSKCRVPVFIDFCTSELFWLKKFDSETKRVSLQIVRKEELVSKNGGVYSPSDKKDLLYSSVVKG